MKQATVTLRKQYIKQYLKLLTQAAEKVDGYFFDDSEESDEVRPYFYGSMAVGLLVTILIIITVV